MIQALCRRTLEYLKVLEEAVFRIDVELHPGHGQIHFKTEPSVMCLEGARETRWLTVYAVEDLA